MDQPDDLEEYLRGDSALSRRYRGESAPAPPHVLDRRVLRLSREAHSTAQCTAQRLTSRLQPLAFAACVLLSVALVLAIVFGPQTAKRTDDNAPRLVRVAARADVSPNVSLNHRAQLYGGDLQRPRAPVAWLADIAALRRAGRNSEADTEYRRFRSVYPGYRQAGGADHSNGIVIGP
jgi:negative regulator of sigma E activity